MSGAQPVQAQLPQQLSKGIVKQVLSGDTVVIRNNNPAKKLEKTISFSSITAPKLARRATPGNQSANQGSQGQGGESKDEPYAWESREFVRKKLIGQVVSFAVEKTNNTAREYGTVFLVSENGATENITESLVKEGLASVREEKTRSPTPEMQRLRELLDQAKNAKRGIWSEDSAKHVRDIKWQVDNPMNFVDKMEHKPIKAVIEHVRDGSTVRAFLLPDFQYITLQMCGIRCPTHKLDNDGKPDLSVKVEFAEEARYFTETRLLQQDVEIVLESINNTNFVGTIIHPKGNIAEELLKAGLAKCVDWHMTKMKKADVEKLKRAEKLAQEKRLRIFKDYTPPAKINDKEFVGTVMEVINGDALMVKLPNGTTKKIFLASIRPPRDQNAAPPSDDKPAEPRRAKRPLYEVPWMFEAREFLRKKLIGKKVNVTVDYVQPARDNFPEKLCCTVLINNVNVAEAMLTKGLASLIYHKQTDDQRASGYEALIAAENKAMKGNKGVHSKKDLHPVHRVNDICGDPVKAKNLLPHIKRSDRIEALVEFVANGSRLRLYLPKDSHLIIFLLSGVEVRHNPADGVNNEEAAMNFTKERCLQRDVEIQVEAIDKNGNFTGWLWVDKVNLSVALVEAGLAKIHFTGLNSIYAKELQNAKNTAKARGLWKYVDKEETEKEVIEVEDKTVERKLDYKEVLVVETTPDLTFYCQYASQGSKLNALQAKLSQEMTANPPLAGSYTPKRGDICAAKYPVDDQWYRAKIERVSGTKVTVLYIDYGNRDEISSVQCASLPPAFSEKPYANQYGLAFVSSPTDPEDQKAAAQQFQLDVQDRVLLLNFEYVDKSVSYVTLYDPTTKEDIGKNLVAEGHVLVAKRKERRMEDVIKAYKEAENTAKTKRLGMWVYGDVTEDDDKEFGMGR